MTRADIDAIPRPASEADYAARYRANLDDSRAALERAQALFARLRHAGQVTESADPKRIGRWIFADANAARAYGDVVRHQSDLEHWHARAVRSEGGVRAAAVMEPDPRLPPERELVDEWEP
jgi:hypothetical protein